MASLFWKLSICKWKSTKNRFWAPVDTIESDIGLNSLSDMKQHIEH